MTLEYRIGLARRRMAEAAQDMALAAERLGYQAKMAVPRYPLVVEGCCQAALALGSYKQAERELAGLLMELSTRAVRRGHHGLACPASALD